jgi:hypothetical protein
MSGDDDDWQDEPLSLRERLQERWTESRWWGQEKARQLRRWITRFRPFRRWAPPPPLPPSGRDLLTINIVTQEALKLFRNSNSFLRTIEQQHHEAAGHSDASIGSALRIRLPDDYCIKTSATTMSLDEYSRTVLERRTPSDNPPDATP